MLSKKMLLSAISVLGVALAVSIGIGLTAGIAEAQCPDDDEFTTDFRLKECKFMTKGINPHFILIPGYKLILEGEEEDDEGQTVKIRAERTVLSDIEKIEFKDKDGNKIKLLSRVVEEREYEDGDLIEVSRNFFAICKNTNSVYYFGEDVDDYEDGEIVGHVGAWRAGENDAIPGLMMPGTFLLGSKYFQERAEADESVDRGENTAMGLDESVTAGNFKDCVEVVDTNPAEQICDTEEGDVKVYCPGVGLVKDEELELVEYGIDYEYLIKEFVSRFYRLCLNRDPDKNGLDGWTNELMKKTIAAADIAKGFIFSQEFIKKNTSDEDYLTILYQAFFDRDADNAGWNGWLNVLKEGKNRSDVLDGFINSQEFVDLSSEYGINPK